MSTYAQPRPSGPTRAPGRRLGAGLDLSPSIPDRSKRLELGFPAGGRYTRARKARRWSRMKANADSFALLEHPKRRVNSHNLNTRAYSVVGSAQLATLRGTL